MTPPTPRAAQNSEELRAIHFHLGADLHDRLRALADREHRSVSGQLRVILEHALADDAADDEAA